MTLRAGKLVVHIAGHMEAICLTSRKLSQMSWKQINTGEVAAPSVSAEVSHAIIDSLTNSTDNASTGLSEVDIR